MLESAVICHQGRVRERNEDSVLEERELGLWAVADGVGGNGHGDVASQLAVQILERRVRQGQSLIEGVQSANQAILEAIEQNPQFSGMATTLVACRFDDNHFELAWVGDSRAYFIDGTGISQISEDHNEANRLFSAGEIPIDEVGTHPGQHELTQALGQLSLDQIPKSLGELHDGDYLLLCSDGLSGYLPETRIVEVIRQHREPGSAVKELLEQVLSSGAPDNISIALIRYHAQPRVLSASDFSGRGLRRSFDRRPYERHTGKRPWLLGLILLAVVLVVVLV